MTSAAIAKTAGRQRSSARRIWRFFTSVKTAVIFITAVVLTAGAGTFIIQAPGYVLVNDAFFRDWVATEAAPRFGAAADAMAALGLFTIFGSIWLRILLALLSVQVIICTINRWPAIRKALFEPQIRRHDAFYERSSDHVTRRPGVGPAAVKEVLERHHYRVAALEEDSAVYLYGDRNGWAKLATFASHIGLVCVLAGAAFSQATAFERDIIIPDGQTQPLYPVAHPDQIQILNLGFVAEYYDDGRPKDFYTDLVLFQAGNRVAERRIRVNEPLDYQGFVFYQATFGRSVNLEIADEAGNVLYSENTPLFNELGDIIFREISLADRGLGLVAALVPEADGESRLAILGFSPEVQEGPIFNITVPPGGSVVAENLRFTNLGEESFTGIRVRKDPGLNLILLGTFLFVIFNAVTFYLPRRRVWARILGAELVISGTGDRFVDIAKEIDRLAETLGAAGQAKSPAR